MRGNKRVVYPQAGGSAPVGYYFIILSQKLQKLFFGGSCGYYFRLRYLKIAYITSVHENQTSQQIFICVHHRHYHHRRRFGHCHYQPDLRLGQVSGYFL